MLSYIITKNKFGFLVGVVVKSLCINVCDRSTFSYPCGAASILQSVYRGSLGIYFTIHIFLIVHLQILLEYLSQSTFGMVLLEVLS